MVSLYAHNSYRSFLKALLAERQRRNSSYSLRAFARQLSLSPATVSSVISGSRNLSVEAAGEIANVLRLGVREREYFQRLVQLELCKSPSVREQLQGELKAFSMEDFETPFDFEAEYFKTISDWFHFAILSLTEVAGVELTPSAIAARLGIAETEARDAVERLLRVGLMEKTNEGFRKMRGNPRVAAQTPNQALRSYHRQTLQKAIESIVSQSPQERLIGSETLAIDSSDLPEFEKLLDEFLNRTVALAKRGKCKNEVYHVGVQIFRLTGTRR